MTPHDRHSVGSTKPHPWQREFSLVVEQALLHVSGGAISEDALSRARYRLQTPTFREPFYLRRYGRLRSADSIVFSVYPADDLFTRRAAVTMYIKDLAEQDVRTRMSETLQIGGFVQGDTLDSGYTAYSDGLTDLEVFIHARDIYTSISIRRA